MGRWSQGQRKGCIWGRRGSRAIALAAAAAAASHLSDGDASAFSAAAPRNQDLSSLRSASQRIGLAANILGQMTSGELQSMTQQALLKRLLMNSEIKYGGDLKVSGSIGNEG